VNSVQILRRLQNQAKTFTEHQKSFFVEKVYLPLTR